MTTTTEPVALTRSIGSLGQCLMWLMQRDVGAPGMLNVPITYRFRGPLDTQALAVALGGLVSRHEGLRTSFEWTESVGHLPEALEQIIQAPAPVAVEALDLTSESDPEAAADEAIAARLGCDIDLGTGRPFTVDLFRIGEDDHLFVLNVHHIVTDAWSNMILRRDLGELYSAARQQRDAHLEPVEWTFRDYVGWQQDRLAGEIGTRQANVWRDRLERAKYLSLRPAPDRPGGKKPVSENLEFQVSPDQAQALRELAKRERTTLFVVMLSLYISVLRRESGADDIAVGSMLANRPRRELYDTVGVFANLNVLSGNWPSRPSFLDVMRSVRQSVLEVLAHQDFPYLNTLTDSTMPPTALLAHEVVFNMFALPNTLPRPGDVAFDGLIAEPLPIPQRMGSRFDLELVISPLADGLEGEYRYAPDRYDRPFIERLAAEYRQLIESVLADPSTPLEG